MNGIGERLESVKNELNLSYNQMSKDLDIPYNNIVRYIKGTRIPSVQIVLEFSMKYGIDIEWLLFGQSQKDVLFHNKVWIAENQSFKEFVKVNRDAILAFLNHETNYKEPIIIKCYRHKLGLSNKEMKKNLLYALEQLRKQENKENEQI